MIPPKYKSKKRIAFIRAVFKPKSVILIFQISSRTFPSEINKLKKEVQGDAGKGQVKEKDNIGIE